MEEALAFAVQHESLVLSEGHITDEEKKQFVELVTSTSEWWNSNKEAQSKLEFYKDPLFTLDELENKRVTLHNFVHKLLNKPKPSVEQKKEEKPAQPPADQDVKMEEDKPSEDVKMD